MGRPHRSRSRLLGLSLPIFLAACGSGGDDDAASGGSTSSGGGGAGSSQYTNTWSTAFQNVDEVQVPDYHTIATAPQGRTLFAGDFIGPIDLGEGDVAPQPGHVDGFLVTLDGQGKPVDRRQFTDSIDLFACRALDADGQGNAVLVGEIGTAADLGGGMLGPGKFIASFTPDAQPRWSALVGDQLELNDVAAAADGHVVAVGTTGGAPVLGMSAGGDAQGDGFVFELDASGELAWLQPIGGAGSQRATLAAVGADGSVVVAGETSTAIALGTSMVSGDFVAKLDGAGKILWARPLELPASGVAAGSDGRVLVATTRPNDAVVLELDAAGAPGWSHTLKGMDMANAHDIAVDSIGNVVVTGQAAVHLDVDDVQVGDGGSGPYVLVLDPSGAPTWSRIFAGDSGKGEALAVADDGTIILKGFFSGTVDLGSGALSALDNGSAAFVAAFARTSP